MSRTFTRYATLKRRRGPTLWVVALGLAAVAVAAAIAGWIWLGGYLESEDFRKRLSGKTSAFFSVEGEFEPLRWSGTSVFSNRFAAVGLEGSAFAAIEADILRADLDAHAIWQGVWRLRSLDVGRLNLDFRTGDRRARTVASAPERAVAASWLPDRFEVSEARIELADVRWNNGWLNGVRATVVPGDAGFAAEGGGGRFQLDFGPELAVDTFKFRYRDRVLYLTDALLREGGDGRVQVSGEMQFAGAGNSDFKVEFAGLDSGQFLDQTWQRRLSGKLEGDLVVGRATAAGPWRTSGTIRLRNGVLKDLPVLARLAKFTRMAQFETLVLQTAEADFSYVDGRTEIRRMLVESEGLLRVEGVCTVADGRMEGVFDVGLTSGSLRWIPGAQSRVFTESRGAYVWTQVRVSGPVDSPQEDLSPRLIAALEGEIIDTVTGTVEDVGDTLKEGARGVLDLLLPR